MSSTGTVVFPSMNGSPFILPSQTDVEVKNLCATCCWSTDKTCRAANLLSAKHLYTLLSGRIAAISKGGRKEAWDTHVTVAPPYWSLPREVMMYTPFVSMRSV